MKLSIKQFAKKCGVTTNTIRNWDRDGKICSERTEGGHRRFDSSELFKIVVSEKYAICYARVSTKNKLNDLNRQKQVLELYAASNGYSYKSIEDVGSGLNYNKKGLTELITLIENEEINRLIITHKDRLLRLGSEIIFKLCEIHNVKIDIINKDDEKTDYNEELVEDVLNIITVFSAKLYGSRSNKNKKIIEVNNNLFSEENN